jgi:ABC-type transport system involved in cytochrome c biogenesis permease subunit
VAPGPNLGSLERLEHLTLTSVTLGFALLSIGLVTGMIWYAREPIRVGPHWFANPKVLLALITWGVYAVVLHAPINPSFRGRKAAALSIVGFVLMVGVLVAVNLMPQGANR